MNLAWCSLGTRVPCLLKTSLYPALLVSQVM